MAGPLKTPMQRKSRVATAILLLASWLSLLTACLEDDNYPRSISLEQAAQRSAFPLLVLDESVARQMQLVLTDVTDYQHLIPPDQSGQVFGMVYCKEGKVRLRIYQSSLANDPRIPSKGSLVQVGDRDGFFQGKSLLRRKAKLWWQENERVILMSGPLNLETIIDLAERLVVVPKD